MTRERGIAALVLLAVVAVVLLVVLSGPSAPADRADALVPASALVYVHVSTDPERDQDVQLLARLKRLPTFAALRRRVETSVGKFDFGRDVLPWLGREAAVAATPRGTLVILSVRDEPGARAVLRRVTNPQAGGAHAGVVIQRFGPNAAAFTGGFLLLGPESLVNQAIDLQQGRGRPLSQVPIYARAAERRPDDRSVDAWAAGVTSSLALPLRIANLVGGRPVSASVASTDDGVRIIARRLGGASPEADFAPKLLESVPEDALAYVGVRSLEAVGPLLPAAAGNAPASLRQGLKPLLDLLDGETAVSIAPATPEAVVTLSARTSDPARAREALGALQGVIARLLTGSEDVTGQVPTFEERDLGRGVDAFALTLAGGGQLVYAVKGDTVIVSNADDGVRDAAKPSGSVRDGDDFEAVVEGVPGTAQALAFLDASNLLTLGDEAGLDASPTYRAARSDLRKVRAIGVVVRRGGNDTTVELNFLIP